MYLITHVIIKCIKPLNHGDTLVLFIQLRFDI